MLCLGSESKCDICLDQFDMVDKAPTCIPCGHIFCHGCFDQLSRQKCPLCQERFHPSSQVKLYVDVEPVEVQRLQATVLSFADNGASELQLKEALGEFKAFLKKHPRPQFQNLRVCSKMLQYILMLKSRTIELEARSDKLDHKKISMCDRIEELKSELASLREENRELEEEKQALEREYERAEKRNLTTLRTHVAAQTGMMQKYETVVNEWQTLREELRRLRLESAGPQGEASPVIDNILAKETPDDGPIEHIAPLIVSDSQYIISPLADFTGQQLPKALPEIVDPPLAEKLVRLNILSPCGSAMHPYNCSCHPDPRPSGKGRSGSLSSFTQSSSSSGSSVSPSATHPQADDLPAQDSDIGDTPLGGLSLTAPKTPQLDAVSSSPPTSSTVHRKQSKRRSKRTSSPPSLPPPSSGLPHPSLNVDPAGGTSDAETVARGHVELRSRLADLLSDPSESPSATVSSSMPNMAPGSYFPTHVSNARHHDSPRTKRLQSHPVPKSPMIDGIIPGQAAGTISGPKLPPYQYDPNTGAPSLPRTGISVASDAARKVLQDKQKTLERQNSSPGNWTGVTIGARPRAYSQEVPYNPTPNAQRPYSGRHGTGTSSSPMPIPSGSA